MVIISVFLTSCVSKNKSNIQKLLIEKNELLSKIDSLEKKVNYLQKNKDSIQIKLNKCIDWITYLESE